MLQETTGVSAWLLLCLIAFLPQTALSRNSEAGKSAEESIASVEDRRWMTGPRTFEHVTEFDTILDERNANLFSLFVGGELAWGLLEVDFVGAIADRDHGKHLDRGVGWTRHSTGLNDSLDANLSRLFDRARTRNHGGSLVALGYSTEVGLRRDILYASGYWAEGDFGRLASGTPAPLGPISPSFAGVDIGSYRPSLWPRSLDSTGFAVGMQTFFAEQAANWTVELGHRQVEKKDWLVSTSGTALTTRAQYRLTERSMLQVDAYYGIHDRDLRGPQDAESDDDAAALRVELRVDF